MTILHQKFPSRLFLSMLFLFENHTRHKSAQAISEGSVLNLLETVYLSKHTSHLCHLLDLSTASFANIPNYMNDGKFISEIAGK